MWGSATICWIIVATSGCSAWHSMHPRIDETQAPQIVELIPPDDASAVSTDLHEMVVRFDRSMHDGYSLRFHGPNPLYEEPYWRDATELVIPIRLQPGSQYTIDLNDARDFSFVDRRGFALLPTRWQFVTADD